MFLIAGVSEDGIITEKVLSGVLSNPKCQAYFQTLDLDVNEGTPNKKWGQVMDSECLIYGFASKQFPALQKPMSDDSLMTFLLKRAKVLNIPG